ncbi:MAG: MGDG synthase family glycosyltransferase [Anaerolineales bacterium]
MTNPKRILILFSDTGGGHRSAAEAIDEALGISFPGRYDVRLVDVFQEYAPRPMARLAAAYPEMMRHPRAWGLGYRISNGHRRARVLTAAAWPYVRTAVRRLVRERPADLIVCVHPLFIAPVIKALGGNRAPFLTLVTDLMTTHALWYHRGVDLCLVPTEAAAQRALACGLRPNQVRVVGLPVARRFCQPRRDPARLRQELGWPIDRPMVLVVGGGEGMGPVFETAQAIAARGSSQGAAFGLAVVAGRNQRLRQRLESAGWPVPSFVYGYENRIPEMMQAATLLVTKAGPLTVSEALNAGLPMVLYTRVPGQEDGNVQYAVQEGVGVWAPGPERAADAVLAWLTRPDDLARAAEACLRVASPEAALDVAAEIDSWALVGALPRDENARRISAGAAQESRATQGRSEIGDDVAEHVPYA